MNFNKNGRIGAMVRRMGSALLCAALLCAAAVKPASAAPSATGPYLKIRLYEIRQASNGKYQVTADVWLFRATAGVEFTLDYDETRLTPARASDNTAYTSDTAAAGDIGSIFTFAPAFQQDLTHSPTTVDLSKGVIRTGFVGSIVTRADGTLGLPMENPDMGNNELKEDGLRYRPGVVIGQNEGLWIGSFTFSSDTNLSGTNATSLFSIPTVSPLSIPGNSVTAHLPSSVGYRFNYGSEYVTIESSGKQPENDQLTEYLKLADLATSPPPLNETFDPETLNYSVTVPGDLTVLDVYARVKVPSLAGLMINGEEAVNGMTKQVPLTTSGPQQVIPVTVTAGAGYAKKSLTYTITVIRTDAESKNTFTGLELYDQNSKLIRYAPTFQPETLRYDASVTEGAVTGAYIKALLDGMSGLSKAEYTVTTPNGGTTAPAALTLNQNSPLIDLNTLNGGALKAGDQVLFQVTATPADTSKPAVTYTITLHINPVQNPDNQKEGARLRALNLRDVNNRQVPFSPGFSKDTMAYTAPAPGGAASDINRLYVTPYNPDATIKVSVDGTLKYDTASDGSASPFQLTTGELKADSTIRVEITAKKPDGSIAAVEVYTITLEGVSGYITGSVNPRNIATTQNPTMVKAFVSGTVDWEDAISVAQNRNNPSKNVMAASAAVDNAGEFRLKLPAGTYDILIDKGGYLDYVVRGVPLTANGAVVMDVDIGLKVITPGDVSRSEYGGFKDGIIDEKDVSAITGSAFNSTSADYAYLRIYCDFNNDGDVNFMDYSIMIGNLGMKMTIEDY